MLSILMWLGWSITGGCAPAFKTQTPVSAKQTAIGTFIFGADISFIQQQDDEGRTFSEGVLTDKDNGGQNEGSRTFMDNMLARGVRFDILGQSYYPRWHSTLDDLANNLKDLAGQYKKDIIVVEYSQYKRQVNDIVHNLPNGKGLGAFIWEPTSWGEALFDKNSNTRPEIDLYTQMAADYNKQEGDKNDR